MGNKTAYERLEVIKFWNQNPDIYCISGLLPLVKNWRKLSDKALRRTSSNNSASASDLFSSRGCITSASISENQAIFKVISWHYQKTTLKIKKFGKTKCYGAGFCLFVLRKRKREVKLFSKISHNMHSCIHTLPAPPHILNFYWEVIALVISASVLHKVT